MDTHLKAGYFLWCLVLVLVVCVKSETVDDMYVTVATLKLIEKQLLDINRNINDRAVDQAETVNKQNIEISSLKQRIAEQDIKIANQDSQLARLEARIANQDVAIANQDTKIAEQEVLIANQNVQSNRKDVKIADQNTKIVSLDATIAKLRADVFATGIANDIGYCNTSTQDINIQLKRIVSALTSSGQCPKHNEVDRMLQNLTDRVDGFEKLTRAQGKRGGAVYVRWGRTTCPGNNTELVYKGQVGGSHYTHTGAAANHLCLPNNPSWARYRDATTYNAYVYGTEIANEGQNIPGSTVDHKYHGQDVPCCVCRRRERLSVLMIPGRMTCDQGWKLEYNGYLMAGR